MARDQDLEASLMEADSPLHAIVASAKQLVQPDGAKALDYKKLGNSTVNKLMFWQDNLKDKFGQIQPEFPFTPDLCAAMALKEQGNELFRQKQMAEAREMYTRSLQLFPVNYERPDSNREYAVVWANRSATLELQGPYSDALNDIEQAFKFGYPRDLYFKLYNRKGHCLLQLKRYLQAKETFKQCQSWIGKSNMNEKQREMWHNKLRKQLNVFNVSKSKLLDMEPPPRPLSDKIGPLLKESKLLLCPSASGHDTQVVSNDQVQAEELLLAEKPHAFALTDMSSMCPVSCKSVAAPVCCSFGSEARFSSMEARDQANASFHKYEAGLIPMLKRFGLSPKARLALRMVTIMSPEKARLVANKLRARRHIGQGDLDEELKVWQLPVDPEEGPDSHVIVYLLAVLLMRGLEATGYSAPSEDLLLLLKTSLLISHAHAIQMWRTDTPDQKSQVWDAAQYPKCAYGVAIYPRLAVLANASAISSSKTGSGSSVIKFFQDDVIIVQAVRQIQAGRPIDLGDAIRGKVELMMPQDLVAFKCDNPKCTLSFPLPEKTSQNTVVCPLEDCHVQSNIWLKRKRMVELKRDAELTKAQLDKGKIRAVITSLHHLIAEWDKIVARPYHQISMLEQALANLMLLEHADQEDEWLGFWCHWIKRIR